MFGHTHIIILLRGNKLMYIYIYNYIYISHIIFPLCIYIHKNCLVLFNIPIYSYIIPLDVSWCVHQIPSKNPWRRISLWMLRFRRSWAFSSSRDWFLAARGDRGDQQTSEGKKNWTQRNWFFEVSDMLIAFLSFHILVYSTWMYMTHHLRLNSRYSCTSIFVDIPIVWIAPFQSLAQFWARP